MRRLFKPTFVACTLGLLMGIVACNVDLTGAPCDSSGNCPAAQFCLEGACVRGSEPEEPSDFDAGSGTDAGELDSGEVGDAGADAGPALPECSDGIDNDCDGKIDFGGSNGDPGCTSASDTSERGSAISQCDNGTDDDGDGLIDYVAPGACAHPPNAGDPGCTSPSDILEGL